MLPAEEKLHPSTTSPDGSSQVHRSQPGGAAEALDPGGGCRALVAEANTQPTYWDKPQGDQGFIAPVCSSQLAPYVLACMTTSGFHLGMSPGTDSRSPGAQMRILSAGFHHPDLTVAMRKCPQMCTEYPTRPSPSPAPMHCPGSTQQGLPLHRARGEAPAFPSPQHAARSSTRSPAGKNGNHEKGCRV